MRLAIMLAAVLVLAGCSGLSGEYLTSPDSGYGFEFDGDTVYSLTGSEVTRGDYTVEGQMVRICFAWACADFRLDGDCLVDDDGDRLCKD